MSLLNAWFNAFLRSRRAGSLFRRRALPEAGFGRGAAQAAPSALTDGLLTLARLDDARLLAALDSHSDGLSPQEAADRLARLGPNEVDHEKPLPWWRHLWQCYRNPFNLLLSVLAAVSWLTEDAKATVVIAAMVVLSTLIRFVQEGRSNRAARAPRRRNWPTSTSARVCTAGVPRACSTCRSVRWCRATTSCSRPAT